MTADTDALAERISDAIRQSLSDGEALQCTRVWEAWQYGTMTDEDFTDASEGPLVEEIATAILPIVAEEVRKAKAEAWDEGSGGRDDLRPNPYRATEYKTGDEHE